MLRNKDNTPKRLGFLCMSLEPGYHCIIFITHIFCQNTMGPAINYGDGVGDN